MKNKFRIIALTVIMLISTIIISSLQLNDVYADGEITINFHYTRDDKAYDNWSMWIWNENSAGGATDFTVSGDEAVASYKCNTGTKTVGFIVKGKKNWDKDVDDDRSVDVSDMTAGTVDVYITSGVSEVKITKGGNNSSETETTVAEQTTAAEIETTTTAEVESTTATEETTLTSDVEIETQDKYDDPDEDKDVSAVTIILLDVVGIVLIAGIAYLVSSKTKIRK